MLQGYQATIKNNHIHWLETPPNLQDNTDVVVMLLPKQWQTNYKIINKTKKRTAPKKLQGMAKIHGDVVNTPEFAEMWAY